MRRAPLHLVNPAEQLGSAVKVQAIKNIVFELFYYVILLIK